MSKLSFLFNLCLSSFADNLIGTTAILIPPEKSAFRLKRLHTFFMDLKHKIVLQ